MLWQNNQEITAFPFRRWPTCISFKKSLLLIELCSPVAWFVLIHLSAADNSLCMSLSMVLNTTCRHYLESPHLTYRPIFGNKPLRMLYMSFQVHLQKTLFLIEYLQSLCMSRKTRKRVLLLSFVLVFF